MKKNVKFSVSPSCCEKIISHDSLIFSFLLLPLLERFFLFLHQ